MGRLGQKKTFFLSYECKLKAIKGGIQKKMQGSNREKLLGHSQSYSTTLFMAGCLRFVPACIGV